VVVAVGIFAIGEALWIAAHLRRAPLDVIPVGRPYMSRDDWSRSWKPWLRGTALGFPFGALPAGGAETPTFLSYVMERRLSRKSEEFGHGAIEGVAGPEAANNASAAGMFVPLLALGLPVTATAAVLLAAMRTYGIVPGPTLMADQADLVWTLLASLLIGNTLLLVINLPLAPLWAKLLRIPRPQLYAGIPSSPPWAPTRSTRAPSTWRCCSSSGPSGSPCAASASRSCRSSSASSSAR
jgi:putative tricarboxylic transport membrane protein